MQRNGRMNQNNPLLVALMLQGLDGGQSGGTMARPDQDGMLNQIGLGGLAAAAGLPGSQSGPVEESTSAGVERFLQGALGYGVGAGGGAVGMGMGGPVGGAVGMAPGVAGLVNSQNPDIQDVWLHQMMQNLRRYNRGLE